MAKKDLSEYVDEYGFIGHFENDVLCDFGDSAQRTFTYYLEKFDSEPDSRFENALFVEEKLKLIELKDGEYVRHPEPIYWSGRPGTMSRDQLVPIICCLALYSKYNFHLEQRKKRLALNLLKRFGFCWNTKHIGQTSGWKIPDWIGFSLISLFLSSSRLKYLFMTVYLFLDFFFVLNAIALVITTLLKKDEYGIDLNFINLSYTLCQRFSPFAWLARKIYVWFRPQPGLANFPREKIGIPAWNAYNLYFIEDKTPPMQYVMKSFIYKWF